MILAATERSSLEQVEDFRERTARKLRGLRCPLHGQSPRLRFHGATLREVTVQMSGCCDTLLGLANQKIADRVDPALKVPLGGRVFDHQRCDVVAYNATLGELVDSLE